MRATNKSGSNSSPVIKEGFFSGLKATELCSGPQVTKGNINSHVQTWKRGGHSGQIWMRLCNILQSEFYIGRNVTKGIV